MDANIAILFGIVATALLVYMSLWFGFAYYLKRIDVAEIAWGLGFIYIAVILLFSAANFHWLQILALILTIVWGGRLSAHIVLRTLGKGEDRRYQLYREKWGANFWPNSYGRVFLLEGLLMLAVSTPLIAVFGSSASGLNALAITGFVVWVLGIALEAGADWQLRRFRAAQGTKKAVLESGLWRYSRHPNYFGEITAWLGAALVAGSVGRWWGFIGFALITFLITRVSGIPMLEKRFAKDSAYQAYAKRTSILIPLPPKEL